MEFQQLSNMTDLQMQYVRDTIVSEDVHGLFELQKKTGYIS